MTAISISWFDSTGLGTLSNKKLSPGDRFTNWTPAAKPIGPAAVGLGTGRIHRFKFRRDDLVSLELTGIPATQMELMLRLQEHLLNGGVASLDNASVHPSYARFLTVSLAPETEPDIQLTDKSKYEYSFAVKLRASTPTSSEIIPSYLDGLLLWLRADSLSLTDLARFGTWTDMSGNSNDATQSTSSLYPTYRSNIINGLPAVYFSGGNCFQLTPSKFSGVTAAEMFVVMKRDLDPPTSGQTSGFMFIGNDVSNESRVPNTSGVIVDNFATNNAKTTVNPTPALTNPHIYGAASSSTEWSNYLDGTQLYTTATNTVGFSNVHQRIGGGYPGSPTPDQKYVGYFAEIIIYRRVLSSAERSQINSYCGTKYGITVA